MNQFIQISFSELQPEQKDILIAQLADAGYEGFEETEGGLEAFINKKQFDKSLLTEIAFKYQLQFTQKTLDNLNWNQLWESNFQPVIVDDFAAIRADFHEPVKGVKYEIIITPKMSFGTGHHATTYMMIQQMENIDFRNKSVFDFGTGTGVLAILAEKLGARSVTAIDHDEWSIENTNENLIRNSCNRITVRKADTIDINNKFDVVLANINKHVILENLTSINNHLNQQGILLISGILEDDREEMLIVLYNYRLRLEKELIKTGWLCLKLQC